MNTRHYEREQLKRKVEPQMWCDQCQSRVTWAQGDLCKSAWCKAK